MLDGKNITITGGTGSLGKVLVRRILSGEVGIPERVLILSRDEAKQHEMRLSYQHPTTSTDEIVYNNFRQLLQFQIGDVRNSTDVVRAVRGADIVVNAAALKQVPSCEYFPEQAIFTNCLGAVNVCESIRTLDYAVDVVVGVSTDKACKPVNVMGMTKAVQERVFCAANIESTHTRFVTVRYGNVLASRGSVIPLFLEQLRRGGPLTITDSRMTRFLLSLDEAVDTVFAAIRDARPGETFVPRCPSAMVTDIAVALIGAAAIRTEVTGIRPGEKLHEILISEEEMRHVRRSGGFLAIVPMLPELSGHTLSEQLGYEFSSATSPLALSEVSALLERHQLLPAQAPIGHEQELLR